MVVSSPMVVVSSLISVVSSPISVVSSAIVVSSPAPAVVLFAAPVCPPQPASKRSSPTAAIARTFFRSMVRSSVSGRERY
jgi:hypothetical protein